MALKSGTSVNRYFSDTEDVSGCIKRYVQWKEEPPEHKWKWLQDTPQARRQAIRQGAMFFTTMSFSEEYIGGNGRPEPTRYGDLCIDFDDDKNPENALAEVKALCLIHLPEDYGADPNEILFYASGSKGFHATLPAEWFDSIDGDPLLPLIHKRIIADWKNRFNLKTVDMSLYCMGKGRMFRIENVQRGNGRYKVPLSLEEVRTLSMDEITGLTMAPREIEPIDWIVSEVEELGNLYRTTRHFIHEELKQIPETPPLSEDERKKLSDKLPHCVSHILTALPAKSGHVNFNKLVMVLVTYFQMAGWSKVDATAHVESFLQRYGDSSSYDTPKKREQHWASQWDYLQDNRAYSFGCKFVLGLHLPGRAFDCKKCMGGGDASEDRRDAGNEHKKKTFAYQENEKDPSQWDVAKRHFPLTPFPWEVLPERIADSLQQLGRSHATSATPLPGAAIAILSSVVGATVVVSPKASWSEPLIFWFGDVRPSGAGKTGAPRALCRPLYAAQSAADKEYAKLAEAEKSKPSKDRTDIPRARGYYMTDLTLEGIKGDLSGHGGSVVVLDEISSFVSAQNQYKAKGGNDREAWLCLHDGQPARVVRVKESVTIHNSRVSIFGGIQPAVWRVIFSGKNEILQNDGTLFRFLSTSEGERFYPLTTEAWDELNRDAWESILLCAMRWADAIVATPDWKPHVLLFEHAARDYFIAWRNQITELVPDLPAPVRGFIPKTVGYAARLAGALYLMDRFSKGQAPGPILGLQDVKKGVDAATFYLGHTVNLMRSLGGDMVAGVVVDNETKGLAATLESLRSDADSGRLAIGTITEKYNHMGIPALSSQAMGHLIRRCGLTIPARRFRVDGKAGIYCLMWDQKTENFLKQVHEVQQVHGISNDEASGVMDFKNISPSSSTNPGEDEKMMDFVDFEKNKSINVNPHKQCIGGYDGLCGLRADEKEEVIEL